MSDISTGQSPVTTSAAVAVPYTLDGKLCQVKNIGSVTVYIGSRSVTTANGYPVAPGEAPYPFAVNNPIFAVCASGTGTLAYAVSNS